MMDFQAFNICSAHLTDPISPRYCGLAERFPSIGICRVSATAAPVIMLLSMKSEFAPPQRRAFATTKIMDTTEHGNRAYYFFFAIIAFPCFTMLWPTLHIARAGITFLGAVFLYALISGKIFPASRAFFDGGGISFPPTDTRAILGRMLSVYRDGKLFSANTASVVSHVDIIAENHSNSKIEPKYCEIANKRIEAERNQLKLW